MNNLVKKALIIGTGDNTATALNDIEAGETVRLSSKSGVIGEIKVRQAIPFGHKLATVNISSGGKILKYGEVIGLATKSIIKGDYIHIHNVESALIPPPKGDR